MLPAICALTSTRSSASTVPVAYTASNAVPRTTGVTTTVGGLNWEATILPTIRNTIGAAMAVLSPHLFDGAGDFGEEAGAAVAARNGSVMCTARVVRVAVARS